MKEKSWPKKGDKYYYVTAALCVGYETVTDELYTDAYERQEARFFAGNFFETFEQAKKMADKAFNLFNSEKWQ